MQTLSKFHRETHFFAWFMMSVALSLVAGSLLMEYRYNEVPCALCLAQRYVAGLLFFWWAGTHLVKAVSVKMNRRLFVSFVLVIGLMLLNMFVFMAQTAPEEVSYGLCQAGEEVMSLDWLSEGLLGASSSPACGDVVSEIVHIPLTIWLGVIYGGLFLYHLAMFCVFSRDRSQSVAQ